MKPISRTALALLSALAIAPAASAVTIIDDFESGSFNITHVVTDLITIGETTGEQSAATVTGGVRLVRVTASQSDALLESTSAGLVTDEPVNVAPNSVNLTVSSEDITGRFQFFYDGNADGTPNGTSGLLALDLSAEEFLRFDMVANELTPPTVQVTMWDGDSNHTESFVYTNPVLAPGANSLALEDFGLGGIDLTDIHTIRVGIQDVTDTVTIQSILATPEPGTALLLGLGLAGIAVQRRRSA